MEKGGENIGWENLFIKFWFNPLQRLKIGRRGISHGSPYGELIGDGDFSVPKNRQLLKNTPNKINTFYLYKNFKSKEGMGFLKKKLCSIQ